MNGENTEAIIFDMDGVITDTEPLHARAELLTCRHFGFAPPGSEWDKFKGKKSEDIFGYLLSVYGGGRDIPVTEIMDHKTRTYLSLSEAQGIPAVPGVVDFIKRVRPAFRKIALATSSNSSIQKAIFDGLGLWPYFDAVITGDDLSRGKPDPEAYLKASAKIGVPAGRCLVIEDSDNGVRAARGAGCRVVGITTSFPREYLLAMGAHHVVDDYDELTAWLGGRLRAGLV